jgi:hypothetical protein
VLVAILETLHLERFISTTFYGLSCHRFVYDAATIYGSEFNWRTIITQHLSLSTYYGH